MASKTSLSNASTYQEIGEYWDTHDAAELGEQTEVEFKVNIQTQRRYYPIDSQLSLKIKQIAEERGISEETLVNLWVQEKIRQIESEPA